MFDYVGFFIVSEAKKCICHFCGETAYENNKFSKTKTLISLWSGKAFKGKIVVVTCTYLVKCN